MTKPQHAETIKENELADILTTRMEVQQARQRTRELEARLEQLEHGVVGRLLRGCPIVGSLVATIEQKLGACRPAWKNIHLDHMATRHGVVAAQVEAEAQAAYPAESRDVLVIGWAPGMENHHEST